MMTMLWKQSGRKSILQSLVAPDQFKTYEELKTRLDYVLGSSRALLSSKIKRLSKKKNRVRRENRGEAAPMPQSMRNELDSLSEGRDFNSSDITPSSDEEDDTLSYFQRLADG